MATPLPPSIFNDVVGPVMRGPSSSHSAASVRIGRLARDLCGGGPDRVLVEFDTLGSLATTHDSQGSDMGLCGGLLGWPADDERLPQSAAALEAAGIDLEIRVAELSDPHPNTYRLSLWRQDVRHDMIALSTGGGMIEVIAIDGMPVSLFGDYDVTLLEVDGDGSSVCSKLEGSADEVHVTGQDPAMVVINAQAFMDEQHLAGLQGIKRIRHLGAVLPVRSRKGLYVPFLHASEMVAR